MAYSGAVPARASRRMAAGECPTVFLSRRYGHGQTLFVFRNYPVDGIGALSASQAFMLIPLRRK